MIEQLKTIREALEDASVLNPYGSAFNASVRDKAKNALTAITQLEAMVGEPAAYLYASIAGPVVLHLLQQIGHAKPLYFQDQLENDLKAQTEYPDAHSCVPLYAGPAAQQPQAPTESVLIDGIAYDTPAPVAAELLRLHLELKQPQAEAVPVVTDAMALAFHRALTDGAIGQSEVEEIKVGLRAALAGHQANAVARVPQWLPIETAPKDWGVTKFDVWANDARFADCWWGKATYESGEPGIVYQSDYDCNGPVDSYVRNATHWMPLPPPPGIVGEKGGE